MGTGAAARGLVTMPLPVDTAPAEPICRSAEDATQPCRYWRSCSETRQQQHAGYGMSMGQLVLKYEPLRGSKCWAYDQHWEREAAANMPTKPATRVAA